VIESNLVLGRKKTHGNSDGLEDVGVGAGLVGEERGPQEALGQFLECHLALLAWDDFLV